MSIQKKALSHFKESGNFDGFQDRTVAALERKKHIRRDESGWTITKRGEALLAGRLGGLAETFTMKKRTHAERSAMRRGKGKRKKAAGASRRDRQEASADLEQFHRKEAESIARMTRKILGPSGIAGAVKITKTDGQPFSMAEADAFEAAGWGVMAASSVAGKAGSGLKGTFREGEWMYRNPADLGPRGRARGLVLAGQVDAGVIASLRDMGMDIHPAPKKLREAIHRNPSGPLTGLARKLYDLILKNTRAGEAWNGEELARKLKVDFSSIDHLLLDLAGSGLIHSPGADMFGSTWLAGAPTPGLFRNPSNPDESESAMARRSKKAAERWYGDPELVNATKILRGVKFPRAFLDAGRITAIEYESDKFDGETRIYRHEVTKKRRLIISADGSTILITPPFRITKRGIEG